MEELFTGDDRTGKRRCFGKQKRRYRHNDRHILARQQQHRGGKVWDEVAKRSVCEMSL